MFNSKYYSIMIVLAVLLLTGAVAIQALEMQQYNLFSSLSSRFFKKAAPAEVAVKNAASGSAAAPAEKK